MSFQIEIAHNMARTIKKKICTLLQFKNTSNKEKMLKTSGEEGDSFHKQISLLTWI